MCLILTVAFAVATYVFYLNGLTLQALISGGIALVSIGFLVRKLIRYRRCLFGKERDCNPR